MSHTKSKSNLSHLSLNDPRVTAAVLKRIEEMPFEELDALLSHRNPGVIERQYPDPTPVTREELLRKQGQPT